MAFNLELVIISAAFIIFITVLIALKRGRVPIKYSLFWIVSVLILLFLTFFPNLFTTIAGFLGFTNMVSMVIGIFIFILFIITISLTIIVSGQNEKIKLLIQEISILKKKVDDSK